MFEFILTGTFPAMDKRSSPEVNRKQTIPNEYKCWRSWHWTWEQTEFIYMSASNTTAAHVILSFIELVLSDKLRFRFNRASVCSTKFLPELCARWWQQQTQYRSFECVWAATGKIPKIKSLDVFIGNLCMGSLKALSNSWLFEVPYQFWTKSHTKHD